MKTNRQIEYNDYTKRRRFETGYSLAEEVYLGPNRDWSSSSEEAEAASMRDWSRYDDDVKNSDSFEVGDYPHINLARSTGYPMVVRIYDSSHTDENLDDDMLLYLAKLAICFYNIREDACFHNVKVVMATNSGIKREIYHITFEATSRGGSVAVTFQTRLVVSHPNPFPRFEILFVRIKPPNPESENSQQDQPSESDHKGQLCQQRISQVLDTYTLDSKLDSRYSLALYLSQYALHSYNLYTLSGLVVAKHDIESLKVVNLVKTVAKDITYHITFKAPLRAKSKGMTVHTFRAEICMPTLFPTTIIQLKRQKRK